MNDLKISTWKNNSNMDRRLYKDYIQSIFKLLSVNREKEYKQNEKFMIIGQKNKKVITL